MLSVKGCFCHYFYILNHSYKMAEAEAEVAVAEPEKSHPIIRHKSVGLDQTAIKVTLG